MSSLASGSRNSQNNQPLSLQELEQRDRFIHRHIGPSEQDIAEMLQTLGMSSLDELIDKAVPDSIRMSANLSCRRAVLKQKCSTNYANSQSVIQWQNL